MLAISIGVILFIERFPIYRDYFNKIKELLYVQIIDIERVGFDELPPRFNLVAHQGRKNFIGRDGIFDANLEQFISPRTL